MDAVGERDLPMDQLLEDRHNFMHETTRKLQDNYGFKLEPSTTFPGSSSATYKYKYHGKKALPATHGGHGGCGGKGGENGKVYVIGFADSKKIDPHNEPGE